MTSRKLIIDENDLCFKNGSNVNMGFSLNSLPEEFLMVEEEDEDEEDEDE